MREIVLDTETTGLDPLSGHRIIEIGAQELLNHVPTGNSFHCYIDPQRDVDQGAFEVHGLSREFLSDFTPFSGIVDSFLEFIGKDRLIIHNARFDMGFINMELNRLGRDDIPMDGVVDTLQMARRRFPGAQASLDALCRRFEIDNSHRDLHGALVDADLLASVYLELIGGRQPGLELAEKAGSIQAPAPRQTTSREERKFTASPEERAAHGQLLDQLTDPIWRDD
ncbi:MAG: DNA polymerase III subunit epsilon [Proteobacteria bacterium]|nr:DNA polymerase III subunit epsilon [Pseudomonadota bacterium]MDA1308052.1 DNA polymerase III subunit epsilon [Pseudomonadota bacterium]